VFPNVRLNLLSFSGRNRPDPCGPLLVYHELLGPLSITLAYGYNPSTQAVTSGNLCAKFAIATSTPYASSAVGRLLSESSIIICLNFVYPNNRLLTIMSSAGVLENGPDHRRTAPKMRGLSLVLLSFQTLGRFYFFPVNTEG
jgi:hypothetical protein